MITFAKTADATKTQILRDGEQIGVIRKVATGYRVSLVHGVRPVGSLRPSFNWATERTLKLAKQVVIETL